MPTTRLRHFIATRCVGWCFLAVLLAAIQPFIAVHFRHDGWEDEPGFRIRSASASTQFEPDNRPDHPTDRETTLFVSSAANIDLPDALQHGINHLRARLLLLLPLTVAAVLVVEPAQRLVPEPVPNVSGAPPPTTLWLRRLPETAPPLAS
ncbi:hypothetical protein SAMN05444679_125130 [Variovorax sp. CF079]|uniref:hypothetical protein n=1 Tax=Variovorax sp. CF079 TaxID=1882774 RepID=UPI000884AB12|nr:hypothetical protein [Variovorax sp. CF079]SDE59339.1 hypothetical protein SAMN05444679_125130 [Variovorax sp. CF079]